MLQITCICLPIQHNQLQHDKHSACWRRVTLQIPWSLYHSKSNPELALYLSTSLQTPANFSFIAFNDMPEGAVETILLPETIGREREPTKSLLRRQTFFSGTRTNEAPSTSANFFFQERAPMEHPSTSGNLCSGTRHANY